MTVLSFFFSILPVFGTLYENVANDEVEILSLSSEKFESISHDAEFISSEPQITIFTHGLGSSANDWICENPEDSIPFSMPGDVYRWGITGNNEIDVKKYLGTSLISSFVIDACAPASFIFNDLQSDDMSRTTEDVYEDFEMGLDTILHAYYDQLSVIPKINLVGHSRGGLINLRYAVEHPLLVSNLVSVATPYCGTHYGSAYANLLIYQGQSVDQSYLDLIDPLVYSTYMNQWNQVANQYDISATAIGCRQTFPFFVDSLSAPTDSGGKSVLETFIAAIASDMGSPVSSRILPLIAEIASSLANNNIDFIRGAEFALWMAQKICEVTSWLGVDVPTGLVDLLQSLFVILHQDFTKVGTVGYANTDLCVELNSQLGVNGNEQFSFDRITLTFDDYSLAGESSRDNMPPVLHNLETKNPIVKQNVLNILRPNSSTPHYHGFELNHDARSHYLVCDCGAGAHWDNHALALGSFTSSNEVWTCPCGYQKTKKHDLSFSDFGSLFHGESCSTCGYSDPCVPHVFTYKNATSSYHLKSCYCGLSYQEDHEWIGTNSFCAKCKRRQSSSGGILQP